MHDPKVCFCDSCVQKRRPVNQEPPTAEEQKFLDGVVWGKPLPSVPMPETVPPLDYWSQLEGAQRGYCRFPWEPVPFKK